MANLAQVIKVSSVPKITIADKKIQTLVLEKVDITRSTIQHLFDIDESLSDGSWSMSDEQNTIRNAMSLVITKANDDIHKMVKPIIDKHMLVPKEISDIRLNTNNFGNHKKAYINNTSLGSTLELNRFKDSPVAKIDTIIDVANKLDMLIMPAEYVDIEGSIKDEEYYTRQLVRNALHTVKNTNSLRPWVITPINNYSIANHVNSENDIEFYTPPQLGQSITACKLMIPMLRGMSNQIDSLIGKVDNISQQHNIIKSTLDAQANQLKMLSQQMERQREEAVKAKADIEQANQIAAAERSTKSLFRIVDPMIILLPANVTDIHEYKGKVILGPVWGPDMSDIVLALSGLTVSKTNKHNVSIKKIYAC